MTPTPDDIERARKTVGACTCLDDFSKRGLVDPQCRWCDCGEDVAREFSKIRAEAERAAIEQATKALFESANAARRDAKSYQTREDGGDGSHESCLESAVTFMDAGMVVRALAAVRTETERLVGCSCSACVESREMIGRGHASDCAVHNAPAYPNGPCDCGTEGS